MARLRARRVNQTNSWEHYVFFAEPSKNVCAALACFATHIWQFVDVSSTEEHFWRSVRSCIPQSGRWDHSNPSETSQKSERARIPHRLMFRRPAHRDWGGPRCRHLPGAWCWYCVRDKPLSNFSLGTVRCASTRVFGAMGL